MALYFTDLRPLDGPAAVLDWRLDGQITRLLLDGRISGRAGEHVMLQNNGKLKAGWVLMIGGGKWHGLCRETHAALVRHMLVVARQAGFRNVSLAFMPHEEVNADLLRQQVNDALAAEGEGIDVCRYSCETVFTI